MSANPPSTLDSVVSTVSTIVNLAAPVASLIPGASIAIAILKGVLAEEPNAVALYNQITSGTPPTAAQLATYASNDDAAYTQLNADITAALASSTPPSP